MSIRFLTSGLLSTIQDLGRFQFRRFGINPNGAMDRDALRLLNTLLRNEEDAAAIEMHFPAPKILFENDALIAIAGADFGAQIDGRPLANWQTHFVEKNEVLSFAKLISGNRAYLIVHGGFEIENWLGSASTNLRGKFGGFHGRGLKKDDILNFTIAKQTRPNTFPRLSREISSRYLVNNPIRVIAGAEFEMLDNESRKRFLSSEFTIRHESDRMGFRLSGDALSLCQQFELVSSAIDFGTIQLLPDGQLIILMADHQTTGGYPRIAHAISRDRSRLAQLGAGDSLRFEIVTIEEAEKLALEFERDLNLLKVSLSYSKNRADY